MNAYDHFITICKSPEHVVRQLRFAYSLLPSDLRRKPDFGPFMERTIHLAACGLAVVEEQFGLDPLHPKTINGAIDHGVIATYHNAVHTRVMMLRDALAYARMRRLYDGLDFFPDRDLVLLVLAASLHDVIQGNGRGVDERLSSELAVQIMQNDEFPYTDEDIEKVQHAILATAFNAITKQQSVSIDRPHTHMQEALAIGDLLNLCRPDGPVHAVAHVPEFFQAVQGGYGQILETEAKKDGFVLAGKNVRDCLRYIGENKRLRAAFADCLLAQAAFFRSHKYHDPRVDEWFPYRAGNANFFLHRICPEYEAGHLTPLAVYDLAVERAQILVAS